MTIEDTARHARLALACLDLTAQHLGALALTPARFRIGASRILNDIQAVLAGSHHPVAAGTY